MADEITSLPLTFRAIDIPRPGGAEVLTAVERRMPVPGIGEVLIKVAAAGVNRADLEQRAGDYPMPPGAPTVPGLEIAGTIVGHGPGVSRFRPGDQVCALVIGGGYAEYCLAPALQCLPIPPSLSVVEAAGLPEALFTVWTAIIEQGRLLPGETLLVHGGASGVGTTAIQVARTLGARVYATAGTVAKCAACKGLGAALVVNYRTDDFVPLLLEMTEGRGIDVILDMVGAPYLRKNLALLATGGRLVEIACHQGKVGDFNIQELMLRRAAITGCTLRHRSIAEKGRIAHLLESRIWPLLAEGRIRPVASRTFPLDQAAAAHRHLEGDSNIGKVILTV
ncbi:MAG: NAD(P)H-quinone oxidoreductase [Acetobacteraceae bacterium]